MVQNMRQILPGYPLGPGLPGNPRVPSLPLRPFKPKKFKPNEKQYLLILSLHTMYSQPNANYHLINGNNIVDNTFFILFILFFKYKKKNH